MTSKGLKGAAEELRRTRARMPGQFASAFERAGGLARQGGQSLKRHYEFVLEAQELRARYAELLARAPELTEKGKQFLTRLELERRAEQFRETSGDLFDRARQGLVVGIAYLIAGLQAVQAKLTPPAHKQLASYPPAASTLQEPPSAAPKRPLRVLLLPASAYSGGNHGEANGPHRRPKAQSADSRPKAAPDEPILAGAPVRGEVRLRDLVLGAGKLHEEREAAKPAPKAKPGKPAKPRVPYSDGLKKTSFKDILADSSEGAEDLFEADERVAKAPPPANGTRTGGSLLDRLSKLEAPGQAPQVNTAPENPKPKAKGSWIPFGLKRK